MLPLGATEPHNLHLPYGTDVFEADAIGEHICSAAHDRGAKVVLLPTIPYGTETNQMAFPLAMNINPSTLLAVIRDLVDSLARHGIHKIVLLNSHGGNDLKPVLRELHGTTPAQLFLCNWYSAISDMQQDIFTHKDDHAGEMETSLALAYFPQFVAQSRRYANGRRRHRAFDTVRGDQSRLGFHHAALALAHHEQRRGQPARRDSRKRATADAAPGRAAGDVFGGVIGGQSGRAISVFVWR